ncbi:CoxG family protein [Amycolatopsis sp. FDAARGOS 1241]|uniref:CoxG family protein n=1 Tax=Amycolatopsis sp. FDAARGOS 1241 TaxID=2778070 RepID=UPI001950F660|nr:SRPBCC domain-containing protein [Amycolatopsis sp. FDAARGOS 1241]QRP48659.1 hypothetical protein I6J71_13005 [Amycolatopsis sp. FDAARGOS 1241]
MPTTSFAREFTVPADPPACWRVLTDVARLAGWVGILDDVKELSPLESYQAVLMDRLGPFRLRADLDVAVSEVEEPRRIRVRAAGEDRQVSSRLGIDATLQLVTGDDGATTVSVTGTYEVVGKVATLGSGMIRQKAAKILDEFTGHAVAELGGR